MTDFWPNEKKALRPPERISVSDWCNRNIILLPESSREPGPYRWQRTPYARDLLNLYKNSSVRHLVLKTGTQIGKSTVLFGILAYIIDQEPFSTLLCYATEDQGREVARTRIQPMIEACPALRSKIPTDTKRYQLTEMTFPGMVLHVVGSNSPTPLAQKPVRNLLRDEVNKWPRHIPGAGDPLELSAERFKAFFDIRKTIDVSSPTDEGGNITKLEGACQMILEYFCPCPKCGALQALRWEQIRFERDEKLEKNEQIARAKKTAHYECLYCKAVIGDEQKDWILDPVNGAGWYPVDSEKPQPSADPIGDIFRDFEQKGFQLESIAARLSSLYSPWIRWGDIVEKFLESYLSDFRKFDKLRSFKNDWLGLEWQDTLAERTEVEILSHRCDYPALLVPEAADALTAGIDCQQEGFYFIVRAWARDSTSWLVRYGYLLHWEDVYKLLYDDSYEMENESGRRMRIWRAAIDTGGTGEGDRSMTAQAYEWLARYGARGSTFGVKGSAREMVSKLQIQRINTYPGNRKIVLPGELELVTLDTGFFKDAFHARLSIKAGDPGAVYLHSECGEDYAKQITAEEKRRDKFGRPRWTQIRQDNHYLDCEIYASCLVDQALYGGLGVGIPAKARPQQDQQQRAAPYRQRREYRPPNYERPNWFEDRFR